MSNFFTRRTPPGIDPWSEIKYFLVGQVISIFFSFNFLAQYWSARLLLFHTVDGKRYLIEGAKIADFYDLIGISFLGFGIVAFSMIGWIIYHYAYFRQGSMSIYLMKRLPRRSEIHRRALTLPCLAVLASALIALVVLLVYFAIYLLATPKACLPDEVWRQLWRIN